MNRGAQSLVGVPSESGGIYDGSQNVDDRDGTPAASTLRMLAPDDRAPVVVIGIGSVLLGDDGLGPTVVELLRAGWDLPDEVDLVDAGTPGLDLAGHLHEREAVILVDAVAAEGAPGEIHCYRGDELRDLPMKPRVSPHDPALAEALWLAELGGAGPEEVMLLGAIPATSEVGTGLSEPVRRAADTIARSIVGELERRLRCRLAERHRASQAWWL